MPSSAEKGKIYKVKGKHGIYPYFPFGFGYAQIQMKVPKGEWIWRRKLRS